MAGEVISCYNKGCGQSYDPNENQEDSCRFHPGGPIFHDALKGWSCCKKRSTDFTEFLNIPGCSLGKHNNEKPEPIQTDVASSKNTDKTGSEKTNVSNVVIYNSEEFEKKSQTKPLDRPLETDAITRLNITVGASLKQALDKQMKSLSVDDADTSKDVEVVQVGTCCKNNSCKYSYEGEKSDLQTCTYHPGQPIFHEGMKYWTCCQRKTSDFDNFLSQEGCTTGKHVWIKKEDPSKKIACRQDWHQTAQFVTISVFSKMSLPDLSWVDVNGVKAHLHIAFDGGQSVFEKRLVLQGIIDPARSNVKMLGTKVEINLRKAEPGSWKNLEIQAVGSTKTEGE